jgi:ADP-ribose pyrophosphatase YjhB (NUDIX family)
VQRVGAYVVCVREGRLLVVRLNPALGLKGWSLPGGGVDHGEAPVDAAVREVAEETGYDVVIDRLLSVDSLHLTVGHDGSPIDHHGIRVLYAGTVVGGELRHEVGGSSDQAAWVELDAVDALDQVSLVGIGLAAWRAVG